MNLYRNFLIVFTITALLLPTTLTAKAPEDLKDNVRVPRRIPPKQPAEDTSEGLLTSCKKAVGNGLCWAGDHLSADDDKDTRTGQLKANIKNMAYTYVLNTFGLSAYEHLLDKKPYSKLSVMLFEKSEII